MSRMRIAHLLPTDTASPLLAVDFLIDHQATLRHRTSEIDVQRDQAHKREDSEDEGSGRCCMLCGRIGGIAKQLIHGDAHRLDQAIHQPGTHQDITPRLSEPQPCSSDSRHREPEGEVLHPARVRGQTKSLEDGGRLGGTDRRNDPAQPDQGVEAHDRPYIDRQTPVWKLDELVRNRMRLRRMYQRAQTEQP